MDPLLIVAVLLLAISVAMTWRWMAERRRLRAARDLSIVLAGHADLSRTPFELLRQAAGNVVNWMRPGARDTIRGL